MDQIVPNSGEGRVRLQEKGQFWTPTWVARPMVAYALAGGARSLFDPAVGPGTFFVAAREEKIKVRFSGCELHGEALAEAHAHGLSERDLEDITLGDFLAMPLRKVPAIVSNPPYIRHHRIPQATKARLQVELSRRLGLTIDGRAGLHVYFFIRCLEMLEDGGRLAFIVSADVCEGVFARKLWEWVLGKFRLDAVVTFAPEAAPFSGVDTNALIFLIRNTRPSKTFAWAHVKRPELAQLRRFAVTKKTSENLEVFTRDVAEGLATGLSRPPLIGGQDTVPLAQLATVMRGIATGDNDFFVMTSADIVQRGLDAGFFRRCVGRTRDCPNDRVGPDDLDGLDSDGRPTWLLDLPHVPEGELPEGVQRYLVSGIARGSSERALIKQRRRWYRMEQRRIPPLLFAYLGRRSSRFILNEAGVVPLTGFLCVYPKPGVDPESLWHALNDDTTLGGLRAVGKSYGHGAIKVEPRGLDRLAIQRSVLSRHGIKVIKAEVQGDLLETA